MFLYVYNFLKRCRKCSRNNEYHEETSPTTLSKHLNIPLTENPEQLSREPITSTTSHTDTYIIQPPLTREQMKYLGEELVKAVKENSYDRVAELLKMGANPIHGIRVSKSPNILSLLYQHENEQRVIRKIL